jgi:hypothetical protein
MSGIVPGSVRPIKKRWRLFRPPSPRPRGLGGFLLFDNMVKKVFNTSRRRCSHEYWNDREMPVLQQDVFRGWRVESTPRNMPRQRGRRGWQRRRVISFVSLVARFTPVNRAILSPSTLFADLKSVCYFKNINN